MASQVTSIKNKSDQNGKDQTATTTTTKSVEDLKASLATSCLNNLNIELMSMQDVYKLAREFIKAKEGTKAVQLTYDDRNMMNVLTKQINNCKLEDEKQKVGFLDLVGKDRLQIWKSLGDMPRDQAMKSYIELVTRVCPIFLAHLEAHLKKLEEEHLKLLEEEKRRNEMSEQKEKKLREEDVRLLEENKKKREEIQRKQIQEALNQQTYPHFKAYAEQQHPSNPQAQEELIKQLQEQHFEQYMNQVYQQQLLHQQQQAEQLRAIRKAQKKQDQQQTPEDQLKKLTLNESTTSERRSLNPNPNNNNNNTSSSNISSHNQTSISHESVNISLVSENEHHASPRTMNGTNSAIINQNSSQQALNNLNLDSNGVTLSSSSPSDQLTVAQQQSQNGEDNEEDNEEIELPPISAASMITRKDIREFKESVRKDNDAIIKVGSGETVTVRVPTHEDGRLIFWEFATDYYDLGFGLYFEWTISPSNNVTVHVSDSSEDEEGEEGDETGAAKQDVEKGDKSSENKPPIDEIIPIFRRDSHEEVYAGSHLYPGRGVYLLKFDNSYSLWRSKTLYYRVYYSK